MKNYKNYRCILIFGCYIIAMIHFFGTKKNQVVFKQISLYKKAHSDNKTNYSVFKKKKTIIFWNSLTVSWEWSFSSWRHWWSHFVINVIIKLIIITVIFVNAIVDSLYSGHITRTQKSSPYQVHSITTEKTMSQRTNEMSIGC